MKAEQYISVLTKYLKSLLKNDWAIDDYPVRLKLLKKHLPLDINAKPWVAQIINWWTIAGLGDSREEALRGLAESFESYKSTHDVLPRPGVQAPIEYVSTERVDKYEKIAVDFFKNILNIDYYNCWISDESSIYDFRFEINGINPKIKAFYGFELGENDPGKLCDIFEKIEKRRARNITHNC
jgi:hypothetical protein